MKRITAVIILLMLLTACGKSEFGVTENTGKHMTITAVNADKDDFFIIGSLEVADGEEITAAADLTKGSIRVEIFRWADEQNADKLPAADKDAVTRKGMDPAGDSPENSARNVFLYSPSPITAVYSRRRSVGQSCFDRAEIGGRKHRDLRVYGSDRRRRV